MELGSGGGGRAMARAALHALVVLLIGTGTVLGGGVEKGLRALDRGDYETALRYLESPAREGDPLAQAGMFHMMYARSGDAQRRRLAYRDETGRNAPSQEALLRAYRQAAEENYGWAQYRLGQLYLEGESVECDDAEAATWFQKCAEKDWVSCKAKLGQIYFRNDDERAATWLIQAAKAGDGGSQLRLAQLHLAGRGVPRDVTAAVELLEKSAESGSSEAGITLAKMHLEGELIPKDRVAAYSLLLGFADERRSDVIPLGDEIARDLTEEEVQRVAREARRLFQKGEYRRAYWLSLLPAHRGIATAQVDLGQMYAYNYGTSLDVPESLRWLRLGAEDHDENAQLLIKRVRRLLTDTESVAVEYAVANWKPKPWAPGDLLLPQYEEAGNEGVTLPDKQRSKAPGYPPVARNAGREARVILQAVVSRQGTVLTPYVVKTTLRGFGFEAAAMKAVTDWTYLPAMKDGEPIDMIFTIRVDFALQ